MSHVRGMDALTNTASPGSLKRKRPSRDVPPSPSAAAKFKAARLTDGASPQLHPPPLTISDADGARTSTYRSPNSEESRPSDSGDVLRGISSASSLNSAASSVFSHASNSFASHRASFLTNGLTPLTNHSESSPPKPSSPAAAKPAADMVTVNGASVNAHVSASDHPSASSERRQMLPPPGKVKGYRAVWDPELDNKLSKEERKRATFRKRDFGNETYESDPPPDPRLAIPGYVSGSCRPKKALGKANLRIAPYNLPPYKIDRYSVGPGEAQQVVAIGFDPFLPESTLRLNFSTFGSVASVQNKTDPETGSFLAIALIKFRDTIRDGLPVTAVDAAKRAETEFNGSRIGLHTIKVELDREGRRCKRHVEQALKRIRGARSKEQLPSSRSSLAPAVDISRPNTDSPAPPPNAPKGPSGKTAAKQPPDGPRAAREPAPTAPGRVSSLIEEEPILSKIKRKPYIHIPHRSVPVLGTTIPHLKKRLKAYDWREVRLDKTGYYVVFEDSKRGEDETERCFNECNKAALFTYFMEMECQKYGNPDYERSPSPERALQGKLKREQMERLQREEAEDIEIEKKNRAENLDPVLGALEQLRVELRDKIMSDIKTRVAIPIFHDSLNPANHSAKRRKLGLPDPVDNENRGSAMLFNKAGDTPPQTPRSRYGHSLSHSKPLRPHDPNQQRGRKADRDRERAPANAFADERRRKPAPRPQHARGLHFRLQQMYSDGEDSDDEHKSSLTRDTEDQESRPLSRASRTSTPFDTDSVTDTPKAKRRKTADWDGADDEKEVFDALQKSLIGHLLHKEPEDLATRELELVVNTLPRSSKYGVRARTELYLRQRSKDDDDLFQIGGVTTKDNQGFAKSIEHVDRELESTPSVDVDVKTIKEKAKKKRKTKAQIAEEREALKAQAKQIKDAEKPVAKEAIAQIEEKELELEAAEELEPSDYLYAFTHDKPRRTVEDDRDLVLDIDGWQDIIKDDEDLNFAKRVFADEPTADLGNVKLWAWKQKEIKALNFSIDPEDGGERGDTSIKGYYVPNSTGSARTEGVKKILNEEKSKYLPHRIKVQKAREERQAAAKATPNAVAEAAKITAAEKIASTATSRSNRVNNRRLVNDINLQKQTLNSDADVAIRFNQLKKRKKLVKFDRSAIHGWGLYALENIAVNDLIIEYVGEKVRQKVADLREMKYDKQGVGSSYLFRMMEDEIIDATKKGGIARFINHSCNPNCTAKIIKVEGTPRIVIYALKDILTNDELTYDYKFEREYGATDRIPCLCGSANCKGFLN
ncbi:Hypothetical protein R9X50_00663600 [Acrodontium crateriforme]|uniref:Histone-lysine N-methyltransferase, H3 lysine-4 specific n=1 Tax=Acrodontium crateriforme TaxID=150365 RepID=A0AAQ3MAF3_9PEZI|nr:Hypothetical protein R9X50_00663600 [Acrodontium crateriforme]